ncbi:MAG: hypothetical protein WCT14_18205 [Treponemataceae bacterium]
MTKNETETRLTPRSIIAYHGGTLSCASGTVWLSWPNGPDILLTAGESQALPSGPLTIIQALGGTATARFQTKSAQRRA